MARTQIDASLVPTALQLSFYRRPTIVWNSLTAVGIERGFSSPSGSATTVAAILFPDGNFRTDSNTVHLDATITNTAVFNGSNQAGRRSGVSLSGNSWYACYAVKCQNNTTDFVLVLDSNPPSRGNVTTLNGLYGTNGWLYLGYIRYGDNSSHTTDILKFVQDGCDFMFFNEESDLAGHGGVGTRLVASTSQVNTWAFTPGMGVASGGSAVDVPGSIFKAKFWVGASNTGSTFEYIGLDGSTFTRRYFDVTTTPGNRVLQIVEANPTLGFRSSAGGAVGSGSDINLYGWSDHALTANWSAQGGN